MPVIAVINRKGGSGKSTLATHVAAYCAGRGIAVMLGDVDRQQSAQTWLRLRGERQRARRAPIVGCPLDPKHTLRVPPGIRHVVLDTPGGLRGFELARVVMLADAILIPVCNSVFDRESSADCFVELKSLPRVANGQCRVAAVGMRLDARTKAATVLRDWAAAQQLPFLGVLRETQAYVHCIERGLTLFDLEADAVVRDMAQWQPILDWLEPVIAAAEPAAAERARPAVTRIAQDAPPAALRPSYRPVPRSLLSPEPQAVATPAARNAGEEPSRLGKLLNALPIPRFLQRPT
jgi:chromosome partitioning protein